MQRHIAGVAIVRFTHRVKRREAGASTPLSEIDIDRLTEILAHRGPPPGLDDEHGSPPGA